MHKNAGKRRKLMVRVIAIVMALLMLASVAFATISSFF